MNRLVRFRAVLASVALAAAAPAAFAEAQVLSFNDCAQGTSASFQVCASADTWYEAATGTLFFKVVNENRSSQTAPSFADYASPTGGWHTIAALGLENMVLDTHYTVGAGGLSLTLNYWNGSALEAITPTTWEVDAKSLQIEETGTSTTGHKQGIVGGYDPGPTEASHLRTTDGRYAQFAITGFTGLAFSRDVRFEWHSKQVATESCTSIGSKCATENSLKGSAPPASTVPEPISMVLLGSGLAGVGAFRARRRRESVDPAS